MAQYPLIGILVASLAGCAALGPVAPQLPPMPYATPEEASADTTYAGMTQCATGPIVALDSVTQPFRIIVSSDGTKFIALDLREGDATNVWLGIVEDGKLVVREVITYVEVKERYPDPCAYFDGPVKPTRGVPI